MVPDGASLIVEKVAVSIRGAGRAGDIEICAGHRLAEIGLNRLRLLAALIELEDIFAIEFPPDATDRFRVVRDIVLYIQSHATMDWAASAGEATAARRELITSCRSTDGHAYGLFARVFGRAFRLAA
jgi:acyl carrier protein